MTGLVRKTLSGVGFLVLVVGVVLYASGALSSGRIEPGEVPLAAVVAAPAGQTTAERHEVRLTESAVGTVRSRRRVDVAAQVTGRIESVAARAGEIVHAGDELVVMDDRELRALHLGAKQAFEAAQAARRRADQSLLQAEARREQVSQRRDRVHALAEQMAATSEEVEAADSEWLQAMAGVADAEAAIAAADAATEQARQGVAGAEVALGHTRVAAPIDGVVAERLVEPGDLAWPGRTLLVVLDPLSLRLEAQVREGLIGRVRRGERHDVALPASGLVVSGTVAEVLPTADSQSRTFEVRVDLPRTEGIHPGMFGRLQIDVGTREVVSVEQAAVDTVGQLRTVRVRGADGWERRLVSVGQSFDDRTVEILSGLAGGEVVGVDGAR